MRIDRMILVPPPHQSCSLIVACLFWSKTMKCLLLFFVVAAVLLPLEAAPLRKTWYKLAPSAKLVKSPTDIWSNCSQAGDPAKILSVVITPDPPVKNQPLTVSATFNLTEVVTNGTIAVKVKWLIITVVDETLNLCDVAKEAGLSCPIAAGTHSVKTTATIPSIAPSGHYTGNVEAKDQNGQELACINLDFHL